MSYLNKGAYLTDIHFGRKNNSDQHNQDCLDFISWFCNKVKSDPSISYVSFLGDWHESRPAIGASTLMHSYLGSKMLNDLGLPIFFVIGNHDLFNRNNRDIYSTIHFNEFSNFRIIDKPTVVDDMKGGMLFSPFLFHDEYTDLAQYLKLPVWAGHFEFKGFVITGSGVKMETGPDPRAYHGPKHIFSGHYHKRQSGGNVYYIGNTFPMDFSDANDTDRGMMVYDHTKGKPVFYNWDDGPRYTKIKITDILDGKVILNEKMRVSCIADIPLTYEETTVLKEKFTSTYGLREFTLLESGSSEEALTGTETVVSGDDLSNIDQIFEQMIKEINTPEIEPEYLIELYRELKVPL